MELYNDSYREHFVYSATTIDTCLDLEPPRTTALQPWVYSQPRTRSNSEDDFPADGTPYKCRVASVGNRETCVSR